MSSFPNWTLWSFSGQADCPAQSTMNETDIKLQSAGFDNAPPAVSSHTDSNFA